jgi:tape measure domain-containing protein
MAANQMNVILNLNVNQFQKALRNAQKNMERFGRDMQRLGSNLTQTLTLPILGAGGAAVSSAIQFEQLEARLRVLTGSAEEGAAVFERIKTFAAQTPFEVGDLVEATSQLVAFGFSADEALNSLQYLGDIAAATGSNINEISLILGQARTVGVAFTQDLRQLASRGIPVFEMLQEETGLTGKAFNKFVADGGVTFDVLNRILQKTASEGGKFFGGMQMQSQTLGGALSNFKDSASIAFAELGKSIAEATNLNERLRKLSDYITALVQRFKELSPEAKQTAVNIALVLSAIGPVTFVIGKFATVIGGLIGQMSKLLGVVKSFATFMLGIPGIILAAVAAITYLYYQSDTARKVINGLVDSVVSLVNIFRAGGSAAEGFFAILRGDATSAGVAFLNMQNALNDFQTQIGDVDFNDAENRISGSIERLKEKINNLLTIKPTIVQPTTTTGPTTTPTTGTTTGGLAPVQPVDLLPSNFADQIESINVAKSAQDKLNESLLTTQERQSALREENERKIEQSERIAQSLERENTLINGITSAVGTLTDSIFEAISTGKDIFKSVANSIKQLVVQLIKAVVQAAILSTLLNIIAPGSSLVTSGKATFSALLGLPGFASGGLVTGPTVALVGEGAGTTLSNPEVIAPLDKLKSMLDNGMNDGAYIAQTRIQGSDLLLSIERAKRDRTR